MTPPLPKKMLHQTTLQAAQQTARLCQLFWKPAQDRDGSRVRPPERTSPPLMQLPSSLLSACAGPNRSSPGKSQTRPVCRQLIQALKQDQVRLPNPVQDQQGQDWQAAGMFNHLTLHPPQPSHPPPIRILLQTFLHVQTLEAGHMHSKSTTITKGRR